MYKEVCVVCSLCSIKHNAAQCLCEGRTPVHPHVMVPQCVWEQAYGGTQVHTHTHTLNVLLVFSVTLTWWAWPGKQKEAGGRPAQGYLQLQGRAWEHGHLCVCVWRRCVLYKTSQQARIQSKPLLQAFKKKIPFSSSRFLFLTWSQWVFSTHKHILCTRFKDSINIHVPFHHSEDENTIPVQHCYIRMRENVCVCAYLSPFLICVTPWLQSPLVRWVSTSHHRAMCTGCETHAVMLLLYDAHACLNHFTDT